MERVIEDLLDTRDRKRNSWRRTSSHRALLLSHAKRRRKVQIRKIGAGHSFLQSGVVVGGIYGHLTTLVSGQAFRASESWDIAAKYLEASGIPHVPESYFHSSAYTKAATSDEPLGELGDIPPAGSRSFDGITEPDRLREAWKIVQTVNENVSPAGQPLGVVASPDALRLRTYVVGEEVVAAVVLVPLYVRGDGKSSVKELVNDERHNRSDCTYLSALFPSPDSPRWNPALDSQRVPAMSEIILLSDPQSGTSGGGVTVDVLEDLSSDLLSLALDAAWAFPGLSATGVDILTPSLKGSTQVLVASVDPSADVAQFEFPTYGRERRVGAHIVDHMISAATGP